MANLNFENPYLPDELEPKWQKRWEQGRCYEIKAGDERPKWYALSMYPYPSGDVHVGHWYAFAPADAHARFMRMKGFNVFHPQGFDAFGLPAENAAITHKISPRKWTMDNIANMRRQFRLMGNSYDWSREVVTCQPEYYKWNQYFFIKMFERGLAYRAKATANWCTGCNTSLANEQVKEGVCERCGSDVVARNLRQWFFKITDYADELLQMDELEWPAKIKAMQTNWIGKSEGVTVHFEVEQSGEVLKTFTTRADTLFGVEFIAMAPEHPAVESLTAKHQARQVADYVRAAKSRTELERLQDERSKTGVHTGVSAVNPLNGKRIPIFVADYVLQSYGSGVVMGVPAHDQRDFLFAKHHDLPITTVVKPAGGVEPAPEEAYTGTGTLVNSDEFDGLEFRAAQDAISAKLEARGAGSKTTIYRLRDWLISRQRYWGTPIPIVYCADCGTVPVACDQLPVKLPDEVSFLPSGESPLKLDPDFVNTNCPSCGGAAKRETDTMDTFMDSSWYHLRFLSPHETDGPFRITDLKGWTPVHQYTGGAEHAVMHLLYARFFCKVLRDFGMVDFDEPYKRLFNQGLLVAEHKKISKRSNPLNPEPLVKKYGADAVRCYLMFLGPWDQGGDWSHSGINGVVRWLKRVWVLAQCDRSVLPSRPAAADQEQETLLLRLCHTTSKRVIQDLEQFKFNTAVAALMELVGGMLRIWEAKAISRPTWELAVKRLLLHIAPLAPHIAEELWERIGQPYSIHSQVLPEVDDQYLVVDTVKVAIQINGRLRGVKEVPPGSNADDVLKFVQADPQLAKWLNEVAVKRTIYVPDKLLNLVVATTNRG